MEKIGHFYTKKASLITLKSKETRGSYSKTLMQPRQKEREVFREVQ